MRIVAMNEPVTIERALIGREISLDDSIELSAAELSSSVIQNHPPSVERKDKPICRKFSNVEDAFHLNSIKSSHVLLTTKRDDLTKTFEISVALRTLDQQGIIFVVTVS